MNDKTLHDIDKLLNDDIPQADPAARKQAIKMAGDEYSQSMAKNSQGTLDTARRIDKRDISSNQNAGWLSVLTQSIRSFFMNNNNSMAYKGFVTAGVAFLAVSVIFVTPKFQNLNDDSQLGTQKIDTSEYIVIDDINLEDNTQVDGFTEDEASFEEHTGANANLPFAEPNSNNKPIARDESSTLGEQREGSEKIAGVIDNEIESAPEVEVTASPSPSQPLLKRKQQQQTGRSDDIASVSTNSWAVPQAILRARGERVRPQIRLDEREEYAEYQSNSVKLVSDEPVSTFSVDVDTASYTLVRNQLNNGLLPKPQAVRAEEFINYFDYDYPLPNSKSEPFRSSINVFDSPWNQDRKLVHIGIKGYDIDVQEQPDSNLVFLLDVSGSMSSANKLPLVKQSVSLLLDTLKPNDTMSIVVYAGAAGTVLEPTKASEKSKILESLQRLNAGGSTAGGAGIQLAYQLAEQNFDKDAVNRIILATDGDFNVGQSSNEDLRTLVERKRKSGVFLSVLGFGRNNYQDDMMQALAQNGNGVAAYIDSLSEAKKVLVDEATSTLFPIAKDVKIQVEFNPATVSEYRLVGYETRALKREDFNNDKVDAGDIGAGHTVTAIYEITPTSADSKTFGPLRYSRPAPTQQKTQSQEYGFLKMRYKLPDSDTSKLIETVISKQTKDADNDVYFSVAVAGFAQLISGSQYTGELNYSKVIAQATKHKGPDPFGYRSEFIQLVRMAEIAKP